MQISGNAALVTGAASGIGRAAALKIADAGGTVLLVARTPEKLEATRDQILAGGGVAHIHRCDLSDADDIDRAVRTAARAAEKAGVSLVAVGATPVAEPGREHPLELGHHLAHDVDALGLERAQMAERGAERGRPRRLHRAAKNTGSEVVRWRQHAGTPSAQRRGSASLNPGL